MATKLSREYLEEVGAFLADIDEGEYHGAGFVAKMIKLRAMAGMMLGEIVAAQAGEGMEKEYATHSPNGKGHAKLQIMDHGDEGWDIEFAEKFAWIYLEQSVKGGYHADAEAAAVWRWVGEWQYMEGYPKTREQVEQMIKDEEANKA